MLQRSALNAGEHCRVYQCRHHLHLSLLGCQAPWVLEVLAHQDDAAARTAQCLVCCRCHDVCILQRVVQQSGCNQSCWMCHVYHQQCAYLIGNLAHACIVPFAAVGRATADNQLRLLGKCYAFHLVIVHASCLGVQVVCYRMIQNAAGVHCRTVAQVSALVEVQSHELVAWLQHCQQHCSICLCSGVRLYIGIFCTEELLHAVNGKLLTLVDDLTAAIVAVSGISFGILVGHVRPHSLHHLIADEVLRSDELHALQLALVLLLDEVKNCVVSLHDL